MNLKQFGCHYKIKKLKVEPLNLLGFIIKIRVFFKDSVKVGYNTEEEIDFVLNVLPKIIDRLRQISPYWRPEQKISSCA